MLIAYKIMHARSIGCLEIWSDIGGGFGRLVEIPHISLEREEKLKNEHFVREKGP